MKWNVNNKMMHNINKNRQKKDLEEDAAALRTEEKLDEMLANDIPVNDSDELKAAINRYEEGSNLETPAEREVSVIEAKTTVYGNIECEGDLHVKGVINGDLAVSGKVMSGGKTNGTIEAESVVLHDAKHEGDIRCAKEITLGSEVSVVVGNITAQSVNLLGKVKGNVSVNERCHIGAQAVVIGDICAKVIEVEAGAVIKGHLDITQDAAVE